MRISSKETVHLSMFKLMPDSQLNEIVFLSGPVVVVYFVLTSRGKNKSIEEWRDLTKYGLCQQMSIDNASGR